MSYYNDWLLKTKIIGRHDRYKNNSDIFKKLDEEYKEFIEALQQGNKKHIIEELQDITNVVYIAFSTLKSSPDYEDMLEKLNKKDKKNNTR